MVEPQNDSLVINQAEKCEVPRRAQSKNKHEERDPAIMAAVKAKRLRYHKFLPRVNPQQVSSNPVVQLLLLPVLEPVRKERWVEVRYRSSEYMVQEDEAESNGSQIVERQPYQYQPKYSIPFPYRHLNEGRNVEIKKFDACGEIDRNLLVHPEANCGILRPAGAAV